MRTLEELNVTIKDPFISYTDDGDKNNVPVVFIHGLPLDKSMWKHQVDKFRNSYRVITYDIRGFGNSETGDEKFSIDLFVLDLKLLLDSLGLHKVILCGFSMGGYIALRAMEKFQERFSALILCDTQCGADTQEAKEKRMKSIDEIHKNGLENYADQVMSGFFSTNTKGKKSEEMIEVRRIIESNAPEVVCNTLQALADRSETCTNLDAIEVPVLIMVGSEDSITPPASAEWMQSKIKGSTLRILEKSAHLSNIDNADDFNKHLNDFLKLVTQKKL